MVLEGQPSDATLTEVLEGLRREGYGGDFSVGEDGMVCCRTCGTCVDPASLTLDGMRRLEGVSDPADMAAVLALHCSACNERGSIVVRYGPEAGPGDSALLLAVDDQRTTGADPAESASRVEPEGTTTDPANPSTARPGPS